jgi:hypothetical protein
LPDEDWPALAKSISVIGPDDDWKIASISACEAWVEILGCCRRATFGMAMRSWGPRHAS